MTVPLSTPLPPSPTPSTPPHAAPPSSMDFFSRLNPFTRRRPSLDFTPRLLKERMPSTLDPSPLTTKSNKTTAATSTVPRKQGSLTRSPSAPTGVSDASLTPRRKPVPSFAFSSEVSLGTESPTPAATAAPTPTAAQLEVLRYRASTSSGTCSSTGTGGSTGDTKDLLTSEEAAATTNTTTTTGSATPATITPTITQVGPLADPITQERKSTNSFFKTLTRKPSLSFKTKRSKKGHARSQSATTTGSGSGFPLPLARPSTPDTRRSGRKRKTALIPGTADIPPLPSTVGCGTGCVGRDTSRSGGSGGDAGASATREGPNKDAEIGAKHRPFGAGKRGRARNEHEEHIRSVLVQSIQDLEPTRQEPPVPISSLPPPPAHAARRPTHTRSSTRVPLPTEVALEFGTTPSPQSVRVAARTPLDVTTHRRYHSANEVPSGPVLNLPSKKSSAKSVASVSAAGGIFAGQPSTPSASPHRPARHPARENRHNPSTPRDSIGATGPSTPGGPLTRPYPPVEMAHHDVFEEFLATRPLLAPSDTGSVRATIEDTDEHTIATTDLDQSFNLSIHSAVRRHHGLLSTLDTPASMRMAQGPLRIDEFEALEAAQPPRVPSPSPRATPKSVSFVDISTAESVSFDAHSDSHQHSFEFDDDFIPVHDDQMDGSFSGPVPNFHNTSLSTIQEGLSQSTGVDSRRFSGEETPKESPLQLCPPATCEPPQQASLLQESSAQESSGLQPSDLTPTRNHTLAPPALTSTDSDNLGTKPANEAKSLRAASPPTAEVQQQQEQIAQLDNALNALRSSEGQNGPSSSQHDRNMPTLRIPQPSSYNRRVSTNGTGDHMDLDDDSDDETDNVSERYERYIKALKDDHDAEVLSLESKHQAECQPLETDLRIAKLESNMRAARIAELENELETARFLAAEATFAKRALAAEKDEANAAAKGMAEHAALERNQLIRENDELRTQLDHISRATVKKNIVQSIVSMSLDRETKFSNEQAALDAERHDVECLREDVMDKIKLFAQEIERHNLERATFEAARAGMDAALVAFGRQREQHENEYEAWQKDRAAWYEEHGEADKQYQEWRDERESYEQERNEFELEREAWNKECTQLASQVQSLTYKCEEYSEEIETLKCRAWAAEEVTVARLERRIEDLTDLLDSKLDDLDEEDTANLSAVTVISQESELVQVRRALRDAENEIESLHADAERQARDAERTAACLVEELAAARDRLLSVNDELRQAMEETETHRTRAADYFSCTKTYIGQVERLEVTKVKLEAQVEEAKRLSSSDALACAKLEKQVHQLEQEHAALVADIQSKDMELALLRRSAVPSTPRKANAANNTPRPATRVTSPTPKSRLTPSPKSKGIALRVRPRQPGQPPVSQLPLPRRQPPQTPTRKSSVSTQPVSTQVVSTRKSSISSTGTHDSALAPTAKHNIDDDAPSSASSAGFKHEPAPGPSRERGERRISRDTRLRERERELAGQHEHARDPRSPKSPTKLVRPPGPRRPTHAHVRPPSISLARELAVASPKSRPANFRDDRERDRTNSVRPFPTSGLDA